tara:strand:- start:15 stop:719 length:705 start_codon:yes stop_codon:yes gene_type:complete
MSDLGDNLFPENYTYDIHDSNAYKTNYMFFARNFLDAENHFNRIIKDENSSGGSGHLFISDANVSQASRQALFTAMRYLQISRLELILRVSNYTNEIEEGKRAIVELFSREQNIFWCGTFNFNEQTLNNLANNPIKISINNRHLSTIDAITTILDKARISTSNSLYLAIVYKEQDGDKYLYVYKPNINKYDSFMELTNNAGLYRNSSGIKIKHRNFLKELEGHINRGVLIYSLF